MGTNKKGGELSMKTIETRRPTDVELVEMRKNEPKRITVTFWVTEDNQIDGYEIDYNPHNFSIKYLNIKITN